MSDAAARDDVKGIVEHSERFHRIIVVASGNGLIHTIWSGLGIGDHTALTMVALPLDLRTVAESHQPIVDAIASGDAELAGRVSRDHQSFFEEVLAAEVPAGAAGAAVDEGAAVGEGAAVARAPPSTKAPRSPPASPSRPARARRSAGRPRGARSRPGWRPAARPGASAPAPTASRPAA